MLWSNPSYQHDMVDVTRQVMANAFTPMYLNLTSTYNSSDCTQASLSQEGARMIQLLIDIDSVLLTNENFRLSTWLGSARAWADGEKQQELFFEYDARNQITLWGPNGEISDYAAKQWGGLVSSYYIPRWRIFVEYLKSTPAASYNATVLQKKLLNFELEWQKKTWAETDPCGEAANLQKVLARVVPKWASIFG
jgi:alpha-N-acetylglucosaminidase